MPYFVAYLVIHYIIYCCYYLLLLEEEMEEECYRIVPCYVVTLLYRYLFTCY